MTAITETFEKLKSRGEAALIGYVTAGDPYPQCTPRVAEALIKGGVDILELGLPFSDPIADGPTIQAASVRALSAGTTPRKALEMAREIRKSHDVPVVVMTYYNPVFRIGLDNFFRSANDCMVDGVIVPDLPVEEAADYKQVASACGVDTIFLAGTFYLQAEATQNRRVYLWFSLSCVPFWRNGSESGSRGVDNSSGQECSSLYQGPSSVGSWFWRFKAGARTVHNRCRRRWRYRGKRLR